MSTERRAIVIGSGFAGAVTACRLTEAGWRVWILERGRRYTPFDLPVLPDETSGAPTDGEPAERRLPDFTRAFWRLGQGLWDLRDLGELLVGQAAGWGGGSLIYANVHLRAPDRVLEDWPVRGFAQELQRYYDLAAYVLDVQPAPVDLPKTVQLESAGRRLGNQFFPFRPPLAVHFGRERENRYGAKQGACDMRGECCFGCPKQAKNTLDLNYLAAAEQQGADVRTLAEVVSIRLRSGEYEVGYRDHLRRGAIETLSAPYVFLCAGAVNTTELLLRSRSAGHLPIESTLLGEGYYPNVDELGVVFDCDEEQEVDRGPTITSSLLYEDAKSWLLVQDGGLPTHLEPLLGVFRSPLWLHRNGFAIQAGKPGDCAAARSGEAGPAYRRAAASQGVAYAELPVDSLVDALSGLTGSAIGPNLSLAHDISQSLLAFARGGRDLERLKDRDETRIWAATPHALRGALRTLRDSWLANFAIASEPFVDEFLRSTAGQIPDGLVEMLREKWGRFDLGGMTERELREWAFRLAVQWVWGSEAGLAGAIATELATRVLPNPQRALPRAADLLRWVLDYRWGDGHTAVLLCFGRDSKAARLELVPNASLPGGQSPGETADADDPRRFRTDGYREGRWERSRTQDPEACLRARLPKVEETPERATQEQLLRDVAHALGGELRTDPLWPFLGRRLTVHSQGGCPMGESAKEGVTDPSGEVFGCKGLFVMDAAAFPSPVGVNPSATIAAVAEWKIESFLRRADPRWEAREMGVAAAWAEPRRSMLDPLRACDPAPSASPKHQPIGIRFTEVMKGTHRPWRSPQAPSGPEAPIETHLTVQIRDLSTFLAQDREGAPPKAHVSGRVKVDWGNGREGVYDVNPDESCMRILARQGRGNEARSIDYKLAFEVDGRSHLLDGLKDIRDDARFDVWEDTTTLSFLLKKEGEVIRWGVLRLPASEFFGGQLPSFEATHTCGDPARQAWALAAFGRFFFGHLVDLYVPALDRVVELAKGLGGRGHV